MGLRKTFKTDAAKETNGVWIDVGINDHNNEPIGILISRMSRSNKGYAKALEEATRPHQSAIANEALDNELGNKILREVFVNTILLNWRNLPKSELTGNDEDTELLSYNRNVAIELFDELPELFDDWERRAKSAAAFREDERTANAGNSKKP